MRYYGYPGEEHKVLTEDGYILTNFRIANPGGYPILFIHGMTATSDCWLIGGPAHDLSFHLWRRGYDVWLWNARGNMYSTEHVNMTYDQEKFFLFSMHELGYYDTTASIDYILNVTGHKNVITIGHSMGTTNVLIAGSLRPEYQAKIRLNMVWAQGAFKGHMFGKGNSDFFYSKYVRSWNIKRTQRMLEPGSIWLWIKDIFCKSESRFMTEHCYNSMMMQSGLGSTQSVRDSVLKLMVKFPAGSSLNVFKQQVQGMRSGEFKPLSYSSAENMRRYGTLEPSPYPIGRVTIPTAIYFACCNDWLSDKQDTLILKSRLPSVVRFYEVPNKKFNHGDFLWAKDGYKLLYRDTILLIDEYTPAPYRSKLPI
uniref:Lipase n=1 Tax=Cacopsylla melanoneura TaxID=428564 RepID=A0A8D8Z5X2_9HEMI